METTKVKYLQDPKYHLIQLTQDIEAIADHENNSEIADYSYLLVSITEDDYDEIWGIFNLPFLEANAYKLK